MDIAFLIIIICDYDPIKELIVVLCEMLALTPAIFSLTVRLRCFMCMSTGML